MTKVIARQIKSILLASVSKEQLGFLEGRQIHEAIGMALEGLHSLKTKVGKAANLKTDLSKSYDRVSWIYIRLMLTHTRFDAPFI